MNRKKAISLLLAFAMIGGMQVGCGSASDGATSSENESARTSEPDVTGTEEVTEGAEVVSQETTSVSEASAGSDFSGQEPYTVNIVLAGYGTEDACKEIGDAMTAITKSKYNTSIEIIRYDFSTHQDQVQTALASGEKIDLMAALSWMTIPSASSQGQILALNDLLNEYGKDILADTSADELATTSVNDQVYAVRNNKELGLGIGLACNTEMLEATGMDYSNVKTEADMQPILEKVKKLYPDVYPMGTDVGNMDPSMAIDWLGRDVGVLMDAFSEDTTVVNYYTSDKYYEQCKRRHTWVQNGLIMPEPSINTENVSDMMAAGKVFCATTETKPGIESQWERNTGKDITIIPIVDDYTMTSCYNNYWVIPYTCEQPERAMQILNEIYCNPDLENLLIYGIEGKDYIFTDKENGVVSYPEGVSSQEDTGWQVAAWHMPNELIAYKWETDGADIWDQTKQFNENCHKSPAMGFVWDSTPVTNEIVACTTVIQKYKKGLDTGDVDPDSVWDQMKEEFEEAGIDKVLGEKQRQLDAYRASK